MSEVPAEACRRPWVPLELELQAVVSWPTCDQTRVFCTGHTLLTTKPSLQTLNLKAIFMGNPLYQSIRFTFLQTNLFFSACLPACLLQCWMAIKPRALCKARQTLYGQATLQPLVVGRCTYNQKQKVNPEIRVGP
ncbi:hypothetical protein I79_009174 [Cricetulus griseus]|uniref:Uncharacterized protein n=1 Tax=Cricetulus griseus TaxID=10029 RepID=G3HF21_CRIGR|nr:hypothetical protein I79_009174 [Cricetulus griseus]